MPTTRRACLPASSVTRASTTNEHDADEDHRGGAAGASRSIVVSTGDDPYAERKKLTFEEAERAVPLPTQLKLKEISQELRAWLWNVIYTHLDEATEYPSTGGRPFLRSPWVGILKYEHVARDHAMTDEFENDARKLTSKVKQIFEKGDHVAIFGWLQYVLRLNTCPHKLADEIERALRIGRAAYRVLDRDTIVPIGSDAELETLKRAFADLATSEFQGARAHLQNAAEELTAGRYADSIRESIHSVEATARVLEPKAKALNSALDRLESKTKIHNKLKHGFGNLYGYTSDERGIRHPLLDDRTANVDETDALFMIGACAAFVSYLINKGRAAGLLG
jgi:hypothetical protein